MCYVCNRCCLLQLFLCDYIGVCTTILVVDGVHTRSYWYWMVLGQNLRFLVSSASILQHQPIGHPSQSLQPSPSLHTISPTISISNFSFSSKCICPNICRMNLFKLQCLFVTINTHHLAPYPSKCIYICLKYKMYLSKIQNVFV